MTYITTYITSSTSSGQDNYREFTFDLQLFNSEKTEEATPKRKEEARKKGQVAKSVELAAACIILAAFGTLNFLGTYMYNEITGFMRFMLTHLATTDLTVGSAYQLFVEFALVFFRVVLPLMIIILAVAIAVNCLQVGFVLSFEPITPQLNRINPIRGMQRLFSLRSLVELVKSLAKLLIIVWVIYRFGRQHFGEVVQLVNAEIRQSVAVTADLTVDMALQIGWALLILAAADYSYHWWDNRRSLRMSKQEVKQELKETEGDPLIKSKIKERQRAMAMRRMMQEVPHADVVITNPTHLAVALKYDKSMSAPVVVAKGQGLVAEKIREIAREHGVTIVENKSLARTLYATLDIGQTIPPELYQAVAEVLAYVYRLKKRLP